MARLGSRLASFTGQEPAARGARIPMGAAQARQIEWRYGSRPHPWPQLRSFGRASCLIFGPRPRTCPTVPIGRRTRAQGRHGVGGLRGGAIQGICHLPDSPGHTRFPAGCPDGFGPEILTQSGLYIGEPSRPDGAIMRSGIVTGGGSAGHPSYSSPINVRSSLHAVPPENDRKSSMTPVTTSCILDDL